ncbi:hypothetical protein R3P38DRAFT_3547912 [Favolaschia claudopus]|uniref:Uncharacterized protein n=1 Tax=Favolaschia claudopus TaxID=2862362 RepID=A0AAW0E3I8_9AGAR
MDPILGTHEGLIPPLRGCPERQPSPRPWPRVSIARTFKESVNSLPKSLDLEVFTASQRVYQYLHRFTVTPIDPISSFVTPSHLPYPTCMSNFNAYSVSSHDIPADDMTGDPPSRADATACICLSHMVVLLRTGFGKPDSMCDWEASALPLASVLRVSGFDGTGVPAASRRLDPLYDALVLLNEWLRVRELVWARVRGPEVGRADAGYNACLNAHGTIPRRALCTLRCLYLRDEGAAAATSCLHSFHSRPISLRILRGETRDLCVFGESMVDGCETTAEEKNHDRDDPGLPYPTFAPSRALHCICRCWRPLMSPADVVWSSGPSTHTTSTSTMMIRTSRWSSGCFCAIES